MRVAVFSDCTPERNGAGSYYSDLARQLRSEVGALEMFQPIDKKRLIRLALPLPGDSTQKLITPNVFRLRKQYAALRPHLVIAVTPGPFGLLGLYFARRAQTGFITAFHTHFENLVSLYGDTCVYRTASWYMGRVNKALCSRSDTVLINNRDLMQTVLGLGAAKVDIMGTPIALTFLRQPVSPPRKKLEQVLFAGRLAPEKNLPAIVEAARVLPSIRFVMAGDGPLRKEMETAARQYPNLQLTGWLDRPALCAEIDAADLLLLPSRVETFGTVALEAMARGRPALVAEDAGIHQWPMLKDALFKLHRDTPLAQSLRTMCSLPEKFWQEKTLAARTAAESLNHLTIDQWLTLVTKYGREPVR